MRETGLDVNLEDALLSIESAVSELASKEGRTPEEGRPSLKGAIHNKKIGKYESKVSYQGVVRFIGTFQLASDAALAYDTAARILHGPDHEINFATANDHLAARAIELDSTGLDVDLEDAKAQISVKVKQVVDKIGIKSQNEAIDS